MNGGYGIAVFPQHAAMLAASGIDPAVAKQRGYVSVDTAARLEPARIARPGRSVPGLLLPVHGISGVVSWQYRPDKPRLNAKGRPVKYENPAREPARLDLHPATHPHLGDPAVPLFVTEGLKKVDSLLSHGAAAVVGLVGVDSWRGTDPATGGRHALPDWADIALNGRDVVVVFDSDVVAKPEVRRALAAFTGWLESRGARAGVALLPDLGGGKTGVDDYLVAGHPLADILDGALTRAAGVRAAAADPEPRQPAQPPPMIGPPMSIVGVRKVFRHWFGPDYDMQLLDAVACTAVAGLHLDGPPPWLMIVGGSGMAKTETATSLERAGALVVSTITGPAAMLSGSPERDRTGTSTGGILREVGDRGLIVLKDFTSILSMARDKRAEVLSAFREIHDGMYSRGGGADGGTRPVWRGRATVVAAVTGAYDSHYAVVSEMGERFLLLRLDSEDDALREHATKQALRDDRQDMREQLALAVSGLLGHLVTAGGPPPLTDDDVEILWRTADAVARLRTQVARDFRGDPEYAYPPEVGTRIGQELKGIYVAAAMLGIPRGEARALVARIARDTIPRDRRAAVLALAALDPEERTRNKVSETTGMSKNKTWRVLEELAMLRVVTRVERFKETGDPDLWQPARRFDPAILTGGVPEMSEHPPGSESKTSEHAGNGTPEPADQHNEPTSSNTAHTRRTSPGHPPDAPLLCQGCGEPMLADFFGDGLHATCSERTPPHDR